MHKNHIINIKSVNTKAYIRIRNENLQQLRKKKSREVIEKNAKSVKKLLQDSRQKREQLERDGIKLARWGQKITLLEDEKTGFVHSVC